MRAPSFRVKLLLAMMLVVVGATGTALYVSQRQMERTYQKLFEQQSAEKIQSFTDLQDARLGAVKNQCLDLVASVRVREALEAALEGGDNDVTNLLYARVDSELVTRGVRDDATFAFFNAGGRLLLPAADNGRFQRFAGPGRFQKEFSPIGRSLSARGPQQVGMIGVKSTDDQWQLQQVIVTKVVDPITSETVGALLLTFPMTDLAAAATNSSPGRDSAFLAATNQIKFGIWSDGRIYSGSDAIPGPQRASLAQQISGSLGTAQTNFLIWPETDPHRVFLQSLNSGSGLPATYQVCLYSLADLVRTQHELAFLILMFGVLTLAGAFLISVALTHGLSVPLRELVAGTNEIRRGNFDVKVRVRSRDDIGRLASSFNEMAEGLALKEKYRTVLNLVADEKVARQLMKNEVALGGELREVSAIFCDVRGFTALTQNMPPEEVIDMLNEHMSVLARVVKQHNGIVDKFVGDALMAVFGAPVSHDHDTLDAARCALSLVIEREKLNATSRHKLKIGVGLATGKMVAGCMGSADRLNYTVLGERVNLAARLCSQAQAGQVIIDQTTRDRLQDAIVAAPLPELRLKGFSETIVAYELRGAGDLKIEGVK